MNRPLRYGAIALLVLIVAAAVGLTAWTMFGPGYIESSVAPDIGRWMGIEELDLDIRRIGSSGAEIASLRIGDPDNPALILGPVLIDYAPSELSGGRIDRISVGGAEVYCGYRDGAFYLRGIDMATLLSRFESDAATASEASPTPTFPVKTLRIDNGVLVFFHGEEAYRLSFDVAVQKVSGSDHLLEISSTFYPRGESITVSGRFDLEEQTVQAEIAGRALHTARFADWVARLLPDLVLRGRLDLKGNGRFRLAPFSVDSASADVTYRSGETVYGGISLKPAESAGDHLTLAFRWREGPRIDLSLPPLRGGGPLPFEITGGRATLHWEEGRMTAAGSAIVSLPPSPEEATVPVKIVSPVIVPLTFQIRESAEAGAWRMRAELQKGDKAARPAGVVSAGTRLSFAMDQLEVAGRFGETGTSLDITVSTGEISVSSDDFQATFPGLTAEGRATREKTGPMSASGTLSLQEGALQALTGRLRLNRAAVTLPVRWPPAKAAGGSEGKIAIGAIVWEGRNMGALEGTLRQGSRGVTLSAEHWNLLLNGMGVWVEGDFPFFAPAPSESRIDLSASWPETSPDLDLGRFSPPAKGVKVNGALSAEGHFTFGGGAGAKGLLAVDLEKGVIRQAGEQKMAITGIAAGLRLPYLPDIRSAPAQELRIGKAALGQVAITDAVVAFQVEPGGVLLIERGRCRWAGGEVRSQAVRITPGEPVYELVLYCDRLSLASVLEQFGAVKATGDGTVNGQIPVRMARGDLSFDDGFLYSTPGDGGTIHVSGAGVLTAGIPEGSVQYNQIDLAREALKDYHYEWAKLRLDTEGEDLVMSLHLNGKPMNPLPFVYKQDAGGFIRISEDQVGSRFQGIRLDVNFRLPLNKILEYKELFGLIGSS